MSRFERRVLRGRPRELERAIKRMNVMERQVAARIEESKQRPKTLEEWIARRDAEQP